MREQDNPLASTQVSIISTAEYERLLNPTKRQWQAQVRKLETARRNVQEVDPDDLQALIDRAVNDARGRPQPADA